MLSPISQSLEWSRTNESRTSGVNFETHRASFTGFPLFRHSSSARICLSLSMRSASLLINLERSKPETFFPQVSRKALRDDATAMSTSFSEAGTCCIRDNNRHDCNNWEITSGDCAYYLLCRGVIDPVRMKCVAWVSWGGYRRWVVYTT
jgi:hypothetical protein